MFQLIQWVIRGLNSLCCLAIIKGHLVRGDILILASVKPLSPKGGQRGNGGWDWKNTLVFSTSQWTRGPWNGTESKRVFFFLSSSLSPSSFWWKRGPSELISFVIYFSFNSVERSGIKAWEVSALQTDQELSSRRWEIVTRLFHRTPHRGGIEQSCPFNPEASSMIAPSFLTTELCLYFHYRLRFDFFCPFRIHVLGVTSCAWRRSNPISNLRCLPMYIKINLSYIVMYFMVIGVLLVGLKHQFNQYRAATVG